MEENERFEEKQEEEEEIWSWGAGTEGQLGTEMLSDEHCPQLLHSLSSFSPISLLACGGAHVVALTSGGRVVTWGRGTSGQLGHGEAANNLQPKAIEALGGFVITHVSAGWNHSGFVSDNSNLFTCGDGTFGQLGLGDYLSRSSPVEVSYLSAKHVKQIACGMRHSLALIKGESGDRVFGFGSGKRGQLGISDDKVKSVAIPQVTLGLENVKINAIIANGDHSAAICADGHLYTWGRSFGSDSDMYMPRCLTVSSSFCSAALGWNHALALTGDGEVFMIGGYKIKQTSEDAGNGEIVKKIDALDGIKVLQISSGAEHSALVTDDGSVMTWGWGEHGQLGFGDTNDEAGPRVVSLSHEHTKKPSIAKVYCGSGFTFVVKKHAGRVDGVFSVREAEAVGVREVLSWVKQKGWDRVIVETDAQVVTTAVRGGVHSGPYGLVIQDITCLLEQLNLVTIQFVKREVNMLAHAIAKRSVDASSMAEKAFFDCIPRFISCIARLDFEEI